MDEKRNVVTYKGLPVTLVGPPISVGQRAPDFKLLDIDLRDVTLSSSKGKVRFISTVYSLDVLVCDLQSQLFEQEAGQDPAVVFYTISMDLPFTQARYCRAQNIKNIQTLSDHREASFGKAYGVLIKEMRLLAQAIFIVDPDDMVRYVEYMKEVTEAAKYDQALRALRDVLAECSRD